MRERRVHARRWLAAAACAGVLAGAALAWPPPARAQSAGAAIPEAHGYVNDDAGILTEERRAQLESFLDQLEHKTGAQFAVLTMNSVEPDEPDQYKVRVFEKWKIGKQGSDEGLLLLVVLSRHAILFETGYGLEGTLPDGWEASMLRDLAVPRFRQGQYADGVTAAVLAASQRIAAAKGVTLTWNGSELRYDTVTRVRGPHLPVPFLWALGLFVVFSALARVFGFRGYWGGPWIGGGFGGYGGWGGGFGGGGGGGMSFGGFGGGSSGGGGGGASW